MQKIRKKGSQNLVNTVRKKQRETKQERVKKVTTEYARYCRILARN